jgi:[ribosomal protein S5]-alanine N-acetyltransferase
MEISTARLIIRDLRESDFPEFELTLNESQKACFGSAKSFLDWLISQYDTTDILNSLISFGIFDIKSKELLGTVGVGRHDDLHEPEIFYLLLPKHRRCGFATEAAQAITKWTFENYDIPYLIGTVAVDNIKSQLVLERCGYQFIDTRSLLVHITNENTILSTTGTTRQSEIIRNCLR